MAKPKSVSSPRKSGDRWQVTYGYTDGTEKTKLYDSCSGAKRGVTAAKKHIRRAELRAGKIDPESKKLVTKTVPASADDYDGSLTFWSKLLRKLALEVYDHGDADDRGNLKAIANAAVADQRIHDTTEMEKEVEELKEFVLQIQQARKHGVRNSGGAEAATSPARPDTPLH